MPRNDAFELVSSVRNRVNNLQWKDTRRGETSQSSRMECGFAFLGRIERDLPFVVSAHVP